MAKSAMPVMLMLLGCMMLLLHPALADKTVPSATTDKQAAEATTLTPEQCVDRLTGLKTPGLLRDTLVERVSQPDFLNRMMMPEAIQPDGTQNVAALAAHKKHKHYDEHRPDSYGYSEGYGAPDYGALEYRSQAGISNQSSIALQIVYSGNLNDSGVLDASQIIGVVQVSLIAGSPGQLESPVRYIPDGPFGIWLAQASKTVYLRPLPGRPFVFIEGPASQPTRVVVEAQLSPLIYPLKGGSTNSLPESGSGGQSISLGTVPDFRIPFEEMTHLAAFNSYTIEVDYLSLPPFSYYSLINHRWRGYVRLEGSIIPAPV